MNLQKNYDKNIKKLCFYSLSYCCGLKKQCKMRDEVMQNIGLSTEDYIKLKDLFDKNLLKIIQF
jgi:predicted metal-binding transcription factor (methanogenesis marker protein 9)